jgi:DNA primase
VNRHALDELKQQIALLDYLQAHNWQPARQLSRGRLMGLCPLHADHKPSVTVQVVHNKKDQECSHWTWIFDGKPGNVEV